jgi:hypothetical protein
MIFLSNVYKGKASFSEDARTMVSLEKIELMQS